MLLTSFQGDSFRRLLNVEMAQTHNDTKKQRLIASKRAKQLSQHISTLYPGVGVQTSRVHLPLQNLHHTFDFLHWICSTLLQNLLHGLRVSQYHSAGG